MTYGMSLRALLEGWLSDCPEVAIGGLSQDSRTVRDGDAFVAVQGADGHGIEHVNQAVENGAVAVICDERDVTL